MGAESGIPQAGGRAALRTWAVSCARYREPRVAAVCRDPSLCRGVIRGAAGALTGNFLPRAASVIMKGRQVHWAIPGSRLRRESVAPSPACSVAHARGQGSSGALFVRLSRRPNAQAMGLCDGSRVPRRGARWNVGTVLGPGGAIRAPGLWLEGGAATSSSASVSHLRSARFDGAMVVRLRRRARRVRRLSQPARAGAGGRRTIRCRGTGYRQNRQCSVGTHVPDRS